MHRPGQSAPREGRRSPVPTTGVRPRGSPGPGATAWPRIRRRSPRRSRHRPDPSTPRRSRSRRRPDPALRGGPRGRSPFR
ncbi:hypothetical protein H483_0111845 [Dietzia sp. UCD-THP]|nr:hypothetical protein H483_0111845 [Dietzia sp. UCD-THP]